MKFLAGLILILFIHFAAFANPLLLGVDAGLIDVDTWVASAHDKPHLYQYNYAKPSSLQINSQKLGRCFARAIVSRKNFSLNSEQMMCSPLTYETYGALAKIDENELKEKGVPTLFDYLAASDRVCDLQSGQEEALKKWVLSQNDNSIDLLKMFARALELNNGNIWNAILSIHQLTRNLARFQSFPRYQYKTTLEEAQRFFNKLRDFRGDLFGSRPEVYGDHEGNWYRIWGAMLWRLNFYDDEFDRTEIDSHTCPAEQSDFRKTLTALGSFTTSATFFIDERLEKGLKERDRIKLTTDIKGSEVIAEMMAALRDQSLLVDLSEKSCADEAYLEI